MSRIITPQEQMYNDIQDLKQRVSALEHMCKEEYGLLNGIVSKLSITVDAIDSYLQEINDETIADYTAFIE